MDISDGDTEDVALTDSTGRTLREKMVYMSQGDHGKKYILCVCVRVCVFYDCVTTGVFSCRCIKDI